MTRPGDPTGTATLLDVIGGAPGRAALFVDFDGTIAPIVDDPEAAVAVPGVIEALVRLAGRLGVVAVISGRPAQFLIDRLGGTGLSGVRIFGLYGGEELIADGSIARHGRTLDHRSALEEAMVMARVAAPGARVEDKGSSVALHFRENPENGDTLLAVAHRAATRYGLAVLPGRMVIELAAPAAPDKGDVARRLLAGVTSAACFGDDIGDLTTFDAIDEARDVAGIPVVKFAVGGDSEVPALLTDRADFILAGPTAVAAVLTAVADHLDPSGALVQP